VSSASDPLLEAFLEAESSERAEAVFAELLRSRGAEALAEALLAEASAEPDWRRHAMLQRLGEARGAGALLAPLTEALRDGLNAERRNAARSLLAALAARGARVSDQALGRLGELVTGDADGDVRVLAATALGESGNPQARLPLEAALGDAEDNVVSAAADALGVLGDGRAASGAGRARRERHPLGPHGGGGRSRAAA
jgi:hypothetical protein